MAQQKLARIHLQEKNYRAARPLFERAVVLAPEKPSVYSGLGMACAALNDHEAAVAAFGKRFG